MNDGNEEGDQESVIDQIMEQAKCDQKKKKGGTKFQNIADF